MKSLTRYQVLDLLSAARAESERDYVAILLGFSHGLRVSEIIGLTTHNFVDGYITVKRLKGSERTAQPLCGHQNPLLNEKKAVPAYLVGIATGDKLFPVSRQYFHRIFKEYCRTAGIPGPLAFPHILKHSVAMQTIKHTGIENVRQWLGHKSIASTGAYLKVSDDEAAKAIAAAMRF